MVRIIMPAVLVLIVVGGISGLMAQQPPPPPPAPAEEPVEELKTEPEPVPEVQTAAVIKRAMFTTGVIDREPVDQIETIAVPAEKVFFFTEIVGMEGKSVTHKWTYNEEVKAEVTFDIGGVRWRVYSIKKLIPAWVGKWTVTVVDGEGNKLHEASLDFKDVE